ncbi:MAG: aminopeptidase P family protein [Betaproteobacteria bacterium]|nr:aminopeptidase P family protein [Betaproteobacteria bacterium]
MVTMASKLSFGTGIADWQERINVERMRAERADKMRRVLKKHGVAAIVAARPDNTRYLSGLRGSEFVSQLWYVLFFAEDDPVVFQHAGWYHNYPENAPWIKHWRLARNWVNEGCGPEATEEEAKLFADGIYRELAQRKLTREALAVVGFDGTATEALIARGLKVAKGWPLMLEATKTKTVDEINCLKMAYAVSDAAWMKTWELLKPGVTETSVVKQALLAAQEAGADAVRAGNTRSGPNSFERGISNSGRILQHGDLVYSAYCGIGYLGYLCCYYRTFSVGAKPDRKVLGWYTELVDRMNAVIDAIKPGATTADAAKHFPPASKWGYKDEAEVLSMEIGHGIGMYHYGYPIINRQWSLKHPQVFEEGMTIAIESREGEPGRGVRLEDGVVVTKNGAELIDHWPRDEILVAPRV